MIDLFLFLFLQLCEVHALPQVSATPTPTHQAVSINTSHTAPGPTTAPLHDLLKRDIRSHLCGWVEGEAGSSLDCDVPSATCLWNPQIKLVGCGNSELLPSATACVDYVVSSSGSVNPGVQTCSESKPFCNTAHLPDSYSMFPCGVTKASDVNVALTFTGFKSPIPLPRNLGNDGKITVLTQLPSSTSTLHKGFSSTCTTSTSVPTVVCSIIEDTSNKPSIIAACVGGGVLLLGLPFGIKMIWRKWRWKNDEKAPKQRTHPFARRVEIVMPMETEGPNFLFSQEWHGRQYEPTKRPPPAYEMRSANSPYLHN